MELVSLIAAKTPLITFKNTLENAAKCPKCKCKCKCDYHFFKETWDPIGIHDPYRLY